MLVEDAFQRHGLGAALLDDARGNAREAGITTFVAETLADARHVHRMLRRLGPTSIEGHGTSRTVRVSLAPELHALTG